MSRRMRLALGAGATVAAALWTLAAITAWWLLQAAGAALEGGSSAATVQAVTAWTERPWVQHWLDPDEAVALRDGIDWLLGLGGGPAVWLGSAMTLLGVALVLIWAGGLVLAALLAWGALALGRRLVEGWRSGVRWRWLPFERQDAHASPRPLAP
ncbi:MAG TPA: hypothetical protein VFR90_05550 [Methylibium sp.]|uniref:hypothetical protein n=1 Tax=Methylibium sp. TaxID=2067992 RepID=UPI002DBF0DF8|nr:hypothetical protein [Methylibium sp.]HEU4458568.1 hypothetical protein [Methylibium sp.]